jgi:hypothetical protein
LGFIPLPNLRTTVRCRRFDTGIETQLIYHSQIGSVSNACQSLQFLLAGAAADGIRYNFKPGGSDPDTTIPAAAVFAVFYSSQSLFDVIELLHFKFYIRINGGFFEFGQSLIPAISNRLNQILVFFFLKIFFGQLGFKNSLIDLANDAFDVRLELWLNKCAGHNDRHQDAGARFLVSLALDGGHCFGVNQQIEGFFYQVGFTGCLQMNK